MVREYLNDRGEKLLEKRNRDGFLPSPYNFLNTTFLPIDTLIICLRAREKQRKCIEALVYVNLDVELSFFAIAKHKDINIASIKTSFSGGERRSSYTPSEIKDLIWDIQGVDVDGNDHN